MPRRLEIAEIPDSDEALLKECRVETFRAGGPGGQHQNTTDTGVRIVHIPSGIRATARDERSQLRNRASALKRLREKLSAASYEAPTRVATRVPRREKAKRLDGKKRRASLKRRRRPPDRDGDES